MKYTDDYWGVKKVKRKTKKKKFASIREIENKAKPMTWSDFQCFGGAPDGSLICEIREIIYVITPDERIVAYDENGVAYDYVGDESGKEEWEAVSW